MEREWTHGTVRAVDAQNSDRTCAALRSGDTVMIGDCQARFIADEDFHEIVAETRPSLPGLRVLLVDSMASELLTP